ncbi:MAG: hypothetical protein H6642_17280 [Caldilineaceae bacterium]|nr:hypothetical protein [Caldilineaceae bacterium]
MKINPFDHWRLVPVTAGNGPAPDNEQERQWQGQVLFANQDDSGKTIRVDRRRKTRPGGPKERAEAPKRRDREQSRPAASSGGSGSSGGSFGGSSGGGSSSGGQPSSGGFSLPTGGGGGGGSSLPMLGLLALLVVCGVPALIFFLFMSGRDGGSSPAPQQSAQVATQPSQSNDGGGFLGGSTEQQAQTQPTATTPPLDLPAVADDSEPTWLIMLYQDADDKVLEKDIFIDLNEAEIVGSGGNVQIVSQMDRYRGGFNGDGDWTSTKRFYVTQDDNLNSLGSQELMDLGETNMADGDTLVDFATWAISEFPADRYVLILSDHGMGWPGGWSDPTAGRSNENVPLANSLGDQLYLNEIDSALQTIRERTGIDKFEMVGMDACLMGQLEVFSMLEPHARYSVASQETEPAVGWAYAAFLAELRRNPGMTGGELGQQIVDSYITKDERIVDAQARSEMVSGRGFFGPPSAEEVAGQMIKGTTLTAVDLSKVPALMDSFNNLAYTLQGANQRGIAQARSYSQSFTSIFGSQVPPSYIDIGHFAQLVTESTGNNDVAAAVNQLNDALGQAVVAERHGSGKPGATGVSIYFPNSDLYANAMAGPQSYVPVAARFSQGSVWDDFLAYHYTGRQFDQAAATAAIPSAGETVASPAAGGISVSEIRRSSDTAAPGEPVLLSIDIAGENIGYIKLFVGYVDEQSNSIFMADQDYLESSQTQRLNGIFYPVWPDGNFTMEFEWEPVVFAIDNGERTVQAMLEPESYGAQYEDALYTINGVYTFADDGEQRRAQLRFRNGELEQVFGFNNDDMAGAPSEILPQVGDQFTVIEQWLDLNANGQAATPAQQMGQTLTFNGEPWQWVDLIAAQGNYVVGFIIEDLDGNTYPVYTQIQVE